MNDSRLDRLEGVALFLHAPIIRLFELCQDKLKRTLLLVHGFRSIQEQMLIYQKGRTFNRESGIWEVSNAGEVVTQAKPGQSAHNIVKKIDGRPSALAIDVIPYGIGGALDWTPPQLFWNDLYELAWKLGLDPLGDPVGAYLAADKGHFEEPNWKMKCEGLGLVLPSAEVSRVV